ncbi:hypothetical protein [Stutzerimonas azotifigens]|uniref:hypothetical protein n=1 Tax=Stutzerimonas azotifigens TaxID=291995 RepID=UPI00042934EC|nr:hypothetical protein [Stutzerimonas azotifigens]
MPKALTEGSRILADGYAYVEVGGPRSRPARPLRLIQGGRATPLETDERHDIREAPSKREDT